MEVEEDIRDEAMGEELDASAASASFSDLIELQAASSSSMMMGGQSLVDRLSDMPVAGGLGLGGEKSKGGAAVGVGPVMAASGAQGSVTVALHPLVIMNISDHWTRVKAQENGPKKVIGALIGQQKGRHLELMNSFELRYDEVDDAYVFDKDYYQVKEAQFKQVFSEMEFLGWYTTGAEPDATDIRIHQDICEINESPIFIKMNPLSTESELPVTVHESVVDLVDGEAKVLFLQIPYTLATEEAERIGVDHVARFTTNISGSGSQVAEHLQAQFGAVKMLHSRIKFVLEYIKAMDRGEVKENHEILRLANAMAHQLPVFGGPDFYSGFYNQCNDVTLVSYLASITKSCQTMNQFVNKFNVLYDRQSVGRRMRGMFF